MQAHNTPDNRSHTYIFGTLLVFGVLGLLASFLLSVERIEQLVNPDSQLFCDVSAIFNCSTVMQTWQAKVFGFPNSFIGLMAYPVVITLAVAGLANVRFPRWFMVLAQIFFGLGLLFAYWLFFQSMYVIQVLCPLCLVVTASTTLLFEALLRYNLRENTFSLPAHMHKKVLAWLKKDYDKLLAGAWLVLMLALVLLQFPSIYR